MCHFLSFQLSAFLQQCRGWACADDPALPAGALGLLASGDARWGMGDLLLLLLVSSCLLPVLGNIPLASLLYKTNLAVVLDSRSSC